MDGNNFCVVKRKTLDENYFYEEGDLYPNLHYKDSNGKVTPTLYSSYTKEQLVDVKSVEVDKIKVKGKEELITIYKPQEKSNDDIEASDNNVV